MHLRRTARPSAPGHRASHRAAGALPPVAERLLPWLGGSVLVAGILLAVVTFGEDELSVGDLAPLFVGLSATLAITGLVTRRSARAVQSHDREERARPTRDQLVQSDRGPASGTRSYLGGMDRWATALLELIAHAAEETDDEEVRQDLVGAGEDTDALRELLQASTQHELSLSEAATLHSVCALWETGQERIETLAASVDPGWYRRWRGGAVVERLLRHGPPVAADVELPYRS